MKNKLRLFILTIIISINSINLNAQITVSSAQTIENIVQNNLAIGFENITNISFQGYYNLSGPSQIGYFNNQNTSSFNFFSGIALSTGNVLDIPGSSSQLLSYNISNLGDATLEAMTGVHNTNAAVLEFDFQIHTDTLRLNIIFASEEYPQYVCNKQTDAMGIFLNGPGLPIEGVNIAKISGTNYNIGINSINNGSAGSIFSPDSCESLGYSSLFVNNIPSNNTVAFDGYTKTLRIKYSVIPCTTYHIKFVVADSPDPNYDSGLFIEAFSTFSCIPFFDHHLTNNIGNILHESNGLGSFSLHLPCSDELIQYLPFTISGTAINGIDYQYVADSIFIPANIDSGVVNIIPIADGIAEFKESIVVSYQINCNYWQRDTIWISDYDSLLNYTQAINLNDKNSIKPIIYPNPASNIINISGVEKNSEWELFDLTGRIIKIGVFKTQNNQISIKEIENGIYFIRINKEVLNFVIEKSISQ